MSYPGKNREGREKKPRLREEKALALKIIGGCVAAFVVLLALTRLISTRFIGSFLLRSRFPKPLGSRL